MFWWRLWWGFLALVSYCHFGEEPFSCRFSILDQFRLLSEFCTQMNKTSPVWREYKLVVAFSACVLPCIVVEARLNFKLFADERVPWHTKSTIWLYRCVWLLLKYFHHLYGTSRQKHVAIICQNYTKQRIKHNPEAYISVEVAGLWSKSSGWAASRISHL